MDNLRSNDFDLAICSNGGEEYINLILNKCNISGYFNDINGRHPDKSKSQLTADLLEETKADFAILVGDKANDMNAARDFNLPFIGVTYGYGADEIKEADFIADKPLEIDNIIKLI